MKCWAFAAYRATSKDENNIRRGVRCSLPAIMYVMRHMRPPTREMSSHRFLWMEYG